MDTRDRKNVRSSHDTAQTEDTRHFLRARTHLRIATSNVRFFQQRTIKSWFFQVVDMLAKSCMYSIKGHKCHKFQSRDKCRNGLVVIHTHVPNRLTVT